MVAVAKRKKRVTEFGRRLRLLREAAGLSLAELGERAGGIGYQNIARYERGAVEPNWPTVLDLAAALGVGVEQFADDSPATPDLTDDAPPSTDPLDLPPSRFTGKRK